MSKPANAKLVGLFVVASLALVVAALAIFGSGRFFTNPHRFVLYFDRSVNGLSPGAPVVFRGVKIGSVTQIRIVADPTSLDLSIPVFIEIDTGIVRTSGGKAAIDEINKDEDTVKILIHRGLRARLALQSFVTGQMMVEMEFLPDTPLNFKGDGSIPELPTAVSSMDELAQSIQEVPVREIGQNVSDAAKGVSKLVNSPELHDAVVNLNQTLAELRALSRTLNAKAGPLADKLDRTVDHVDQLAVGLTENMNSGQAAKLLESLTRLSDQAGTVMVSLDQLTRKADGAVENFSGTVSENSEVMTDLRRALKELAATARTLRVWADYLERHPEALIKGKGDDGR